MRYFQDFRANGSTRMFHQREKRRLDPQKKSKTGYVLLPLQFCNLEKWVTEAQFARHLNASTRTLPLSDQQPRCSTVKSHFRVERLL